MGPKRWARSAVWTLVALATVASPVRAQLYEDTRRALGLAPDPLARSPHLVAMGGLTLRDNGTDLARGPVWIADAPPRRDGRRVARSVRIGIRLAAERRWRYFLAGHPCVSGPQALRGPASSRRRAPAPTPGRRAVRSPAKRVAARRPDRTPRSQMGVDTARVDS